MAKKGFDNEYRSIFKGTAVFGGAQLVQIIVDLLRSKVVAILIGTIGMGINALYVSSLQIIVVLSGMGLKSSAVKDIAESASSNNRDIIGEKISTLKKCFLFTCFLGFLITSLCSSILSKSAFGDSSHTIDFILLSFFVVFTLLGEQCTAILQGLHLIKKTALSTLLSCIAGLITSIVFLYFWGLEGIVYNLIAASFISFLTRYFFVLKLDIPNKNIGLKKALINSKATFLLGFAMVVSTLIGTTVTFSINSFISNIGGVSEVGLYKAGLILTTESVSLVFSSMAADYYPKLVTASRNISSMNDLVNSQGEIVTLVTLPILSTLMIFSPIAISILFTSEFLVLVPFVRILCIGVLIQAISYSIGYISFAKGDKKTFFLMEGVWASLYRLVLYCLGYYWGGLQGLAFSYIMGFLTYLLVVIFVTNKLYGFTLNKEYLKVLLSSTVFITCLFMSLTMIEGVAFYSIVILIYCFILIFSYRELSQRLNIIGLIRERFKRK